MRSSINTELNGNGENWRGLRAILNHKKEQLQKFNKKLNESGGAGINDKAKAYRDSLTSDIRGLTIKVDRLTRIESILNDQLKIRQTVGVSKPEFDNEDLIQRIIKKQVGESSPASR
jgi:hypothetical protein